MSELKEFLRPAQLIKHYELLQYLSKHPNTNFTLGELDYVLPHGASLQRFPLEWIEYMAHGGCANRNIELHLVKTSQERHSKHSINNNKSFSGEESDAEHSYRESEEVDNMLLTHSLDRSGITLICRQPEIHSLSELEQLLQSPSNVLDAEGCVALHTDQILISPELIKLAQGAGVAYYFPDKYDKTELQSGSPRLKGTTSSATSSFSSSANYNHEENGIGSNNNENVSGLYSSSDNMWSELIPSLHRNALAATLPHVFLTLPPGVRLRYKLLTTRGVPVKDEYSLPLRLHVAERLLLLFDDVNATVLRYQQQQQQEKQEKENQNTLFIHFNFAAIKLTSANDTNAHVASGLAEAQTRLPLRIRMKTVQMKVGQDVLVQSSHVNVNGDHNTLRASQVRVEMEAVCAAQFKLVINVNGNESIVTMEITEEAAMMPGILIQRDGSPQNFAIPVEWTLHDEFIHEHFTNTNTKQIYTNAKRIDEIKAISPLTWWQYNSPLTSITRDITFPAESVIERANNLVFTPSALAHEKAMRSTRLDVSLKKQQRKEEEDFFFHSSTRRKRRRTSRIKVDLSNKHLLHFGLDTSIPFTLYEQSDTDVMRIE